MYLEMIPEASKIIYLVTDHFKDEEVGEIYREEYTREDIHESLEQIINDFINWLKINNLYELYQEKWQCKY
jgi:hypothetical protein